MKLRGKLMFLGAGRFKSDGTVGMLCKRLITAGVDSTFKFLNTKI